MYAISDELRESWQALYTALRQQLGDNLQLSRSLKYETSDEVLTSPSLLLGQTCGYPLMMRYKNILTPVCVPHFTVDGCLGAKYSSAIVVSSDSSITLLADARGKIAVINNTDSNSGMNVFRAMLTHQRKGSKAFFSNTLLSGSHIGSAQAVATGRADIAAIDCVTFSFLATRQPELISKLRIIEFSEHTTGLPFVMAKSHMETFAGTDFSCLLNLALQSLPSHYRDCLSIKSFSEVSIKDYEHIAEINYAAQRDGHCASQL